MTLNEIAEAVGGKLINTDKGSTLTVLGVTMDSRTVEAGNLFVAIKGERVDGHDFVGSVFDKGAAAALVEHSVEGAAGPLIVVDNSVKALQDLARFYRKLLNIKVIGITGSVGKTSTKEIVASVLSAKFNVRKTIGNYNNEIGLPLTVLKLDEENEISVLEMGISDFGEMRLLSSIACPDVCVITNIGQCHLENLKSRDGILKAKTEIFEYMNPNGLIFLNGDDDKLSTVTDVNGIKPTFFGASETNYAHPSNLVSNGLLGSSFDVVLGNDSFRSSIKIPGNHMIINAVAAAAIGKALGMSNDEIIEGLKAAETIAGRNNLIPYKNGFIIDDCYNASPASVKAGLDLVTSANGTKAAVLGDMFELGTNSDAMHAEVGYYAEAKSLDRVIFVGINSLHAFNAANEHRTGNCADLRYYESLEALLSDLSSAVDGIDTILVKASNGMHFKSVVEALAAR